MGTIVQSSLLTILIGVVLWVVSRRLVYQAPRRVPLALRIGVTIWVCLATLSLSYGLWVASGDGSPKVFEIMSGVGYERRPVGSAVVHIATIDLNNPCVALSLSPVDSNGVARATKAVTWAGQASMILAMNGSFFYPYDQSRYWDVYPAAGEEVTVLGTVVLGDHRSEGPVEWDGHAVWLDADGRPAMGREVPESARWAITGRERVLVDRRVVAEPSRSYPRSVIAIDAEGNTMWWVVVDGVQAGYSDGLPLRDVGRLAVDLGATDAVELDGGGSSVLVYDQGSGPELLSRPIQVRLPGRSRTLANHVGIVMPKADCR